MKNNVRSLFKAELLSAFRRGYGFIFLALYWGVFAYLIISYNLSYTSVDISAILSSMAIAAAIFIPLLTLFGGADGESKKGYSQASAIDFMPFSVFERVSAKYLSLLAVLGIANIPLIIIPLINGYFSVTDYLSSYSFLLSFLAFEVMLLSLSQYIALRIKNVFACALTNYVIFITVFLLGSAKVLISRNAIVSLIGAIVAGLVVGVLIYVFTHKKLISLVIGILLAILPVPFFIISRESFEGLLENLVGSITFFRRLDEFTVGIFDVFAVILFIALSMIFFLLSFKALKAKKTKKEKLSRRIRILAVCMLCVLLLSIVATLVPTLSVPIDATQNGKYSISAKTKEFLGELDEDITINFYFPTSSEAPLLAFLQRYVACDDNLTLNVIYSDDGNGIDASAVDAGTIYVSSENGGLALTPGDLFSYTNETLGLDNLDSYTYAQYLYYFYTYDAESYEILQYETRAMFQGDSVLTTNIEYLVSKSVPTVYILDGHGETELSEPLYKYLQYFDVPDVYGFALDELNLKKTDAVPENTKAILINCPQSDISDREYELLSDYLASGGSITLLTESNVFELENLTTLMSDYGMSVAKSFDNDVEISPTLNYNHEITAMLSQMSTYPVVLNNANSITLNKDAKDSLILTPLLVFAEKNGSETTTHNLAAAAETADGAKLVWITGAESFDDESFESSNIQMIICCAAWSDMTYSSSLEGITPVVYSYPLLEIDSAGAMVFKVIFALLPISVVALWCASFVIQRKKDMANK